MTPVRLARQYLQGTAEIVVARRDSDWGPTGANRVDRLAQQPPHLDDALVGRTQMLLTAVADRPHALLDRAILHVDPVSKPFAVAG